MTLPSSGPLSLSQINTELGRSSNATISLNTAEDGGYVPINQCADPKPSASNPATVSEWYGYNHLALCDGDCYRLDFAPFGGCTFVYKDENGQTITVNIPAQDEGLCFTACVTEVISDDCGFYSVGVGCNDLGCSF